MYDFLYKQSSDESHHCVVVGDLNAEPFSDEIVEWFDSSRSRFHSRTRHHSDKDVSRARLYNVCWRLLGETTAHDGRNEKLARAAGTYFYEKENSWHTLDQILVSRGLVCNEPPFLNESKCEILDLEVLLDSKGRPRRFENIGDGVWAGCSDHFPVFASICY